MNESKSIRVVVLIVSISYLSREKSRGKKKRFNLKFRIPDFEKKIQSLFCSSHKRMFVGRTSTICTRLILFAIFIFPQSKSTLVDVDTESLFVEWNSKISKGEFENFQETLSKIENLIKNGAAEEGLYTQYLIQQAKQVDNFPLNLNCAKTLHSSKPTNQHLLAECSHLQSYFFEE